MPGLPTVQVFDLLAPEKACYLPFRSLRQWRRVEPAANKSFHSRRVELWNLLYIESHPLIARRSQARWKTLERSGSVVSPFNSRDKHVIAI
jgi:hypothetical protein